jgi:glutamine synthetase
MEQPEKKAKDVAKTNRYADLCHAVQTGIAWKLKLENPEVKNINEDPNLREHKHLRVGIDTSKSDQGALAALLIEKGIFTEDEYIDALITFMEREVKSYEEYLSERLKAEIALA